MEMNNMVDNKKTTKTQNDADSILESLLAKGGVEINLDRAMYSADKGGVPIIGFLVDLLDMPPIDAGKDGQRDWQAFVVLLTHDCIGVDREGEVIDVKAGEELVVPATYQIQHALKRFAKDPEAMHQLAIQPKKKIPLGGGKTFWTYRVIATGETKERGTIYALPGAPVKKALPEGVSYDPTTGEVREKAAQA
jgi:hypothetical protein